MLDNYLIHIMYIVCTLIVMDWLIEMGFLIQLYQIYILINIDLNDSLKNNVL